MEAQNPPPQQQAQTPAQAPAPVALHYFDGQKYEEVIGVLVENYNLILGEIQKGTEMSQDMMGQILNYYISTFMRKGQREDEKLPDNSTCQHIFKKGAPETIGRACGKKANYKGVEGLPKCSTHKNSKASSVNSALPSSGSETSSFSYKNNKNAGTVPPQNISSIQASIAEQTSHAEIELSQNAEGIIYNPGTNIVFKQYPDNAWYAVGLLSDEGVIPLTEVEIYLCFSNGWKWEPSCVDNTTSHLGTHPLTDITSDHALVSQQNDLVNAKIQNINRNNGINANAQNSQVPQQQTPQQQAPLPQGTPMSQAVPVQIPMVQ